MAAESVHEPSAPERADVQPPGLGSDDEEDIVDDIGELRAMIKTLREQVNKLKDKEDKHDKEGNNNVNMNNKIVHMSNTYDDNGIQQSLRNFDAKSVCKPVPWNGEDKAEFKM